MGVRGRERVKFKSMRDQSLEFSHIFFIFNPITRIDFHDYPNKLFHDCSFHQLYVHRMNLRTPRIKVEVKLAQLVTACIQKKKAFVL